MLALTIRQPWAALIMHAVNGRPLKHVENRTWRTSFRGRICIHSALQTKTGDFALARNMIIAAAPAEVIWFDQHATFHEGCLLGSVEIAGCVTDHASPFFTGPYGFILRKPLPLATPIPMMGAQKLWSIEDQLARVMGSPAYEEIVRALGLERKATPLAQRARNYQSDLVIDALREGPATLYELSERLEKRDVTTTDLVKFVSDELFLLRARGIVVKPSRMGGEWRLA